MNLARKAIAILVWLGSVAPAFAQFHPRPFAVGGGEGGGGATTGVTGWLVGEQSKLTHVMAHYLHAMHADPSAVWSLVGIGLAYGVFHAAGPGHGKALIASYMVANERSLKRGAVMALLAALLQALAAIAIVGVAAYLFNATASQMNVAADGLEYASYAGIAAVGLWLVWRKGRALVAALRALVERRRALAAAPAFAGAWRAPAPSLSTGAFRAAAPGERSALADDCGCAPMPDPTQLAGAFSWRAAAGTVVAAGMRPCSGAILILVFSLAQGLFVAGIAATFAMALGTAVTTGALATLAVFAKDIAMRFAGGENTRLTLVARSFEFAAALGVLVFGALLMIGSQYGA